MKNITINKIEWHDAEINDIRIESNKDAYDTIKIFLTSEEFIKEYNKKLICIILQEVYKARFEISMWISGKDIINTVSILQESDWIRKEKEKFKNGFGPKNIKHFQINTNTNSCLEFLITKDLILDVE